MKGLIWNCQKVEWRHESYEPFNKDNCLLLYVCCETGDSRKKAREVARRVIQLNKKRYGKNHVVIFPFAHLSHEILEKNEALHLIEDIHGRLEKKIKVSMMGFNKSKEIKIHLLPHNKDVSYFSY